MHLERERPEEPAEALSHTQESFPGLGGKSSDTPVTCPRQCNGTSPKDERLPMCWVIFNVSSLFRSSAATPSRKAITLGQEGRDQARHSRHDVAGCEGKASSNALDGQEDQKGSRQLHDPGDKEVHIEVASYDAQAHDQPLVHHGTGEPAATPGDSREPVRDDINPTGRKGCSVNLTQAFESITRQTYQANIRISVHFLIWGVLTRSKKDGLLTSSSVTVIYTREADFSSNIRQETPAHYRIVIDRAPRYRIDDLTGPGTFTVPDVLKPTMKRLFL